jgi:hypothetical protein
VNRGPADLRISVSGLGAIFVEIREAAEKPFGPVIPSEARDLLSAESEEKGRFLGQTPPSE